MDWHEIVRRHLTEVTGNPARDAEIVEELVHHAAGRFDELRGSGATEQEASDRVVAELRDEALVGAIPGPTASVPRRRCRRRRAAARCWRTCGATSATRRGSCGVTPASPARRC